MSPFLFQGVCCALRAIKPKVYETWSGTKVKLWNWLEKEIGNQKSSFEINQSKRADKLDVCRKSIQNALKTFQKANLIEKEECRTGRGNHPLYSLKWTFREENGESATPFTREKVTPKNILTKGSKTFRYFAYKFRTTVEDSSLEHKSGLIVGKLLNCLVDKSKEIAKSWLIYLKRWLNGPKRTLKDFFVYFHQTLKQLEEQKRNLSQDQKRIADMKEKREKIRKEWKNNPPPKLRDCGSFAAYQKALEKWEESTAEVLAGS